LTQALVKRLHTNLIFPRDRLDYLPRAFTARPASADVKYLFANHMLDTDRRELRRGSEPVGVEPQVFDLLVHLVENRDRVVSKDDLIASVWAGRIVSDSTLTTRINAVRRAVGDSGGEQKLIRTFARKGLRFVAAVQTLPEDEGASAPGRSG
jgi:DNA-binding winged helix-turn-helix (wHTH) protein